MNPMSEVASAIAKCVTSDKAVFFAWTPDFITVEQKHYPPGEAQLGVVSVFRAGTKFFDGTMQEKTRFVFKSLYLKDGLLEEEDFGQFVKETARALNDATELEKQSKGFAR